jgi:hypothetical protein
MLSAIVVDEFDITIISRTRSAILEAITAGGSEAVTFDLPGSAKLTTSTPGYPNWQL